MLRKHCKSQHWKNELVFEILGNNFIESNMNILRSSLEEQVEFTSSRDRETEKFCRVGRYDSDYSQFFQSDLWNFCRIRKFLE